MDSTENYSKKLVYCLLVIFFFSGFSSLIYQVAWQRILTTYYGVGPISIALIVSVYMLGLGAGSLYGGRLADRVEKPILIYFLVEILIGLFGMISLTFLKYLGEATAGSAYTLTLLYVFLFLCIPTFLMGMTLPLLTKIFTRQIGSFFHSVSLLYFINTLGAAAGALATSFLLVSLLGLDIAVYIAVLINLLLAISIFLLQREAAPAKVARDDGRVAVSIGRYAYLLAFICGFLAIGYELVWFRVISVLVKSSPYAFSSSLSVYLVGIAVGSFLMMRNIDRRFARNKVKFFLLLQFLIAVSVLGLFTGYFYLSKHTGFSALTELSFSSSLHPLHLVHIGEQIRSDGLANALYASMDIILWPLFFILLPALLMGASFPLVSLLAANEPNREGKTIGNVYFSSILGNTLGGVVTGFVLLEFFGTEITLLTFILIGLAFGLFAGRPGKPALPVAAMLVAAFAFVAFPDRGQLYRLIHTSPGDDFRAHFEEGRDGTIMTYRRGQRVMNYINGLSHGGRPLAIFDYEVLEAASYARDLKDVLIIGYGTGSFVEMALNIEGVETITVVELNETLVRNLRKIDIFDEMLAHPKIELVIEDGRRYLLRMDKKYDLILIDPLRSTTAYSNNLYSAEFFALAKKHLTPGGVFLNWRDEHYFLVRTLIDNFPYFRIYNDFSIASNEPLENNPDRRDQMLSLLKPWKQQAIRGMQSMEKFDERGPGYYTEKLRQVPANTDLRPRAEYYFWNPANSGPL